MRKTLTFGLFAVVTAWGGLVGTAAAADDAAAQALIKKSGCGSCHAVDKAKEGPSYKETAAKYKGKADAEDTLYKHQVAHKKVKSTNEAEIRGMIKYILAQ